MVAGEGGVIASYLAAYARVHAAKQIRDEITRPVGRPEWAGAIGSRNASWRREICRQS
jgi:hypothetical protein